MAYLSIPISYGKTRGKDTDCSFKRTVRYLSHENYSISTNYDLGGDLSNDLSFTMRTSKPLDHRTAFTSKKGEWVRPTGSFAKNDATVAQLLKLR